MNTGLGVPLCEVPEQFDRVVRGVGASPLEFDDPTVVYFYPRDGTPGCTLEAREFEADIETAADRIADRV